MTSALRPNLSISLPSLTVSPHERSVPSLEKEIMRLQDVLREREQEIAHLEISLKEKNGASVAASSDSMSAPTVPSTPDEASESVNGDGNAVFLSPKTMSHFDEIKSSMKIGSDLDSVSASEAEETMERLNELMRYAVISMVVLLTVIRLTNVQLRWQSDGPEGITASRGRRHSE